MNQKSIEFLPKKTSKLFNTILLSFLKLNLRVCLYMTAQLCEQYHQIV